MTAAFILGMAIGALAAWVAWDKWAFSWTLKHGLRADLFTLSRADVLEEISYVAREHEANTPAALASSPCTEGQRGSGQQEGGGDGR